MAEATLHNELALFRQIAGGDESAFRAVFDHYRGKLAGFAISMTTSEVMAEDIIQEVFINLWLNRAKLFHITHPGSYLFIMTRNKTLDHLRKVSASHELVKQLWLQAHQPGSDADQSLLARESQQLVTEALSQLSAQKQQIFHLSRVQGMNHEEIAAQLGLSKSRVKNIMVEVLKFIREYLARHSPAMVLLCSWLLADA